MWEVFIGAVGGALALKLVEWGISWWRSPRLRIDFEESNGAKPYVHQLTVTVLSSRDEVREEFLGRFLRLSICNLGRVPAHGCVGKLSVKPQDKPGVPTTLLLHWSRNDPIIYREPEEQFGPITIQKGDSEALDLLLLREGEVRIGTCSSRVWYLLPNESYELEVTVFPTNGNPSPKRLSVCFTADSAQELWDRFNTSVIGASVRASK